MKKTIIALAAASALTAVGQAPVTTVTAQWEAQPTSGPAIEVRPGLKDMGNGLYELTLPRKAEGEKQEIEYSQGVRGSYDWANSLGRGCTTFSQAILLQQPDLVGMEIVGVHAGMAMSGKCNNYKIWVSSISSTNMPQPEPDIAVEAAEYSSSAIVGTFSTPVRVPVEGIFVGFTEDVNGEDFPNPYIENPVQTSGNLYYRNDKSAWRLNTYSAGTSEGTTASIRVYLRPTAERPLGNYCFTPVKSYEYGNTNAGAKSDKASGAIAVNGKETRGMQITGALAEGFHTSLTNFSMWVAKGANGLPGEKIEVKSVEKMKNGSTYVKFDHPVTITDEIPFVGFTFENPNKKASYTMPVKRAPEDVYATTALYTQENDGAWTKDAKGRTGRIKVALERAANSALIEAYVDEAQKQADRAFTASFTVTNYGLNPVREVEYEYTLDGKTFTKTYKLQNEEIIPYYGTMTDDPVVLALPVEALPVGSHNLSMRLTKVNGEANPLSEQKVDFSVNAVAVTAPQPGLARAAYYDGEKGNNYGMTGPHFNQATQFKDPNLVGMKVVGIKVDKLYAKGIGNFNVWESSNVESVTGQQVKTFRDGDSIVAVFPKPVEITSAGRWFGYEFDQLIQDPSNTYPTPGAAPKGIANSFWIKVFNREWRDVSDNYGCLTMTLLLEGTPEADRLQLNKLESSPSLVKNDNFTLDFQVVNYSGEPVNSIGYTYKNAETEKSGTVELQEPLKDILTTWQTVTIPFDSITTSGPSQIELTIDQVNGNPNKMTKKTLKFGIDVADFWTTHRPFMEEGTGLGCGWCPRGMLAMHVLKERHPEFIGAAYHRYGGAADPMYTPLAEAWGASGGYPCASIDRGEEIDPCLGSNGQTMGIEKDYLKAKAILSPANLDMVTTWDANKENINVKGSAKFSFVEQGKTYKIGYMLTIDGLSSDERAWKQSNFYAGETAYAGDSLLNLLATGAFDLTVYNHVVIEGSSYMGIANSVPSPKCGERVECEYTIPVKDIALLKDYGNKDNINVIMVLVDNTGKVRNARIVRAGEATTPDPETKPVEDTPNVGISAVTDEVATPVYYDLMGRRVVNPEHGIFVRIQGGKASKVAF